MSSQQREDEGRAGYDAEFAECHAEVSPCQHRISRTRSLRTFLYVKCSFVLHIQFVPACRIFLSFHLACQNENDEE